MLLDDDSEVYFERLPETIKKDYSQPALICGIVSLVNKPKVDTSKAILGLAFGSVSFIIFFLAYIIIMLFL